MGHPVDSGFFRAELAEPSVGGGEEFLQRVGAAALNVSAAHADLYAHGYIEELEANLSDGGSFKCSTLEHTGTETVHQQMGDGAQPEPQLVARHPTGAGAVGEEVHLLLLDSVLHFPALAVEVFVRGSGLESAGPCRAFVLKPFDGEVGDDVTGIPSFHEDFNLGNDMTGARPTTAFLVVKMGETAGR